MSTEALRGIWRLLRAVTTARRLLAAVILALVIAHPLIALTITIAGLAGLTLLLARRCVMLHRQGCLIWGLK